MADEVEVVGLGNLPPWASEKTLADMLEFIESLTDIESGQKTILEKSLREIQKTGKLTAEQAKGIKGTKGSKEAKETIGKLATLKAGLHKTGVEALDTAAGLDNLKGPLKDFGKSLKNSSPAFKGMLAVIGVGAQLVGKFISTVRESVSVLRNLNEQGVRFTGGFDDMHAVLADTGLTLEKFGEISSKYARVMGQNGLRALTNLTLQTEQLSGGFHKYGLTTAEATEYTAEYLDQQRLAGVFGRASQREQSIALQENIERLTSYSKVLNVSRQDLQDASRQMLSNQDLQAELFSMEEGARAKATEAFRKTGQSFAALGQPGQAMLDIFTDIAAAPIGQVSEGYQRLANAGLTDLAEEILQMTEAAKAGHAYTVEDIMILAERATADKQFLANLRLADGEIKQMAVTASVFGQAGTEAQHQMEENIKRAEKEGISVERYMKNADEKVRAAARLDDVIQKFQATAEYGMVKAFSTLLGGKGIEAVDLFSDGVEKATGLLRKGIDGPLTDIMQGLHEGIGTIVDWLITVFKKLGEGIVALRTGLTNFIEGFANTINWIMELPERLIAWAKGGFRTEITPLAPAQIQSANEAATQVNEQFRRGGFLGSTMPTSATAPTETPNSNQPSEMEKATLIHYDKVEKLLKDTKVAVEGGGGGWG